jgi:hypothetical protein
MNGFMNHDPLEIEISWDLDPHPTPWAASQTFWSVNVSLPVSISWRFLEP